MNMYLVVPVLVCLFQSMRMRMYYACIDNGVILMTMYLAVLVLETLHRGRYVIAWSCACIDRGVLLMTMYLAALVLETL